MSASKKLVRSSQGGVTIGSAGLGNWGNAVGSVKRNVHDGDTVLSSKLAGIIRAAPVCLLMRRSRRA